MAYLKPHNGGYLCRAVFNPINVRIHLPLKPLAKTQHHPSSPLSDKMGQHHFLTTFFLTTNPKWDEKDLDFLRTSLSLKTNPESSCEKRS